jgi:hypothetical protein
MKKKSGSNRTTDGRSVPSRALPTVGAAAAAVMLARCPAIAWAAALKEAQFPGSTPGTSTGVTPRQAASKVSSGGGPAVEVQEAEAALRDAREQAKVANRLYLGQVGNKIDFLRAQTQVAQAEQNLHAAQNSGAGRGRRSTT